MLWDAAAGNKPAGKEKPMPTRDSRLIPSHGCPLHPPSGLSRRNFLRGCAACAGAAALSGNPRIFASTGAEGPKTKAEAAKLWNAGEDKRMLYFLPWLNLPLLQNRISSIWKW